MQDIRTELATLIASRICHDLISPVGAISNGLELVALGGGLSDGPELQLITESCDNANARIRFFRVAYGAASDSAMVAASEVQAVLTGVTKGSRLSVIWDTRDDMPRSDVQLAYLAFQCAETALRRGGEITLQARPGQVSLTAQADRISCDPDLWRHLDGRWTQQGVVGASHGVTPAHVQFVLLPFLANDRHRRLVVQQSDTSLTITI